MVEQFPGYRFCTEDVTVEITVFPEKRDRHAPLSPLDGKPMKRAKLRHVELLASTEPNDVAPDPGTAAHELVN